MKNEIKQIRKYISEGEIEKAITKLLFNYSHSVYSNNLFLLSSQFQTNTRRDELGIINPEKYDSIQNRIAYELLEIIKKIENNSSIEVDSIYKQIEFKKVLIVESNPLEKNLYSNIEIREIEKIIFSNKTKLSLKIQFGSSLQNLVRKVNEERSNIVHITAFANDSGIYFHDKSDNPVLIENQILISHLDLITTNVECFLFNTFISEGLAKEMSIKDSFVIGYNGIIDSNDAIDFANGFYNTIGYNKDYKTAFKIGCQTISGENKIDTIAKLFGYYKGEKIK